MATTKKKKMGRPSLYTPELADKICSLIEQGYSERKIAEMEGMPNVSTIRRWKDEYPDFCTQSARAREISACLYNDRRMEKSDALYKEALLRLQSGEDFPKGAVEAIKASMQEDAREAAIRDDSRYGDRKTVKLDATENAGGMSALYEKIREAVMKHGDQKPV